MKSWIIVSAIAALVAVQAQGAEEAAGPRKGPGKMRRPPMERPGMDHAAMLEKFDADGDGKLSDTEKAAAREAMQKKREAARKEWMAKADTDGDGKVSPEEREAAREKMAEANPAMKERMLKRFDKDGDGKLSDDERAEARKARAARMHRKGRPERPERPDRPDRPERPARPERPEPPAGEQPAPAPTE